MSANQDLPTVQGAGRVHVDASRCQGHGRCEAVAPELFELDDLGNARVVGDGVIHANLADKARLARDNCPEAAVSIIDNEDASS